MIKVSSIPVVDGDSFQEEFGFSQFDCEFAQMAENGSYIHVDLDEDAKEALLDDIEWERGKSSTRYNRLWNQLHFVEEMNKLGYKDSVLVFIFW